MGKQRIIGSGLAAVAALLLGFAGTAYAQFGGGGLAPDTKETPRLPGGKPDLTGSWQTVSGAQRAVPGGMFRRCTPYQPVCMEWTNQSQDFAFMHPMRLDTNQPIYKPKYWDKVVALDEWTNRDDPVMTCLPLGTVREGPPSRIYATDKDLTFLYRGGLDGGGGYAEFRMIPLDGRPRDPQRALNPTYFGYTIGSWEGDTLVLDSTSFSDETWLGRGGKFHSDKMRVVEKLTRKGNELLYEVTVEDPEVLAQPWVLTPRTLKLTANQTVIQERGNCIDGEREEVTSQWRH